MRAFLVSLVLLATMRASEAQQATTPSRYELTIEAYVDGPSSLHFTTSGLFWRNGRNAKPGRHDARNEPTYINGKAWMPRWQKNDTDRGADKSDTYAWNPGSLDLKFELVAVTPQKGETGIEKRRPVEARREGNEFVIHIPDPEGGARWYKLVVRAPDPLERH